MTFIEEVRSMILQRVKARDPVGLALNDVRACTFKGFEAAGVLLIRTNHRGTRTYEWVDKVEVNTLYDLHTTKG